MRMTSCTGRLLWACFTALAFALAPLLSYAAEDLESFKAEGATPSPQNWFTVGRDQNQSYYSPLASINAGNVTRLGFAWAYDLGTTRGQEATPLVVDGVMITSGAWGYVYAIDASTGREIWRFDPKADPRAARNPCCDLVNRGVAFWKGRVLVASVDGRLHALDAGTGKELWSADTIVDHKLPYSSTGAVYIAGDLAVIGNSGADMDKGGVRGYVSAYEIETGRLAWRFYTVPGAPGQPPEDEAMALAATTWNPDRSPDYQGGGTAWDGFAYDPDLRLVFFGTANPAPYDLRLVAGPSKDALYTASIVALHADTGRLAWHYQTTPGDHWDFDATQKLVLADLRLRGVTRSVIMQANKNGFFYVLDRRTGEFISAKPYTFVNWTSGLDSRTGRPRPSDDADWYSGPKNVYPSWAGGHSWQPMSFNPVTGLIYIPVIDASSVWIDLQQSGGRVRFVNSFLSALGIFPDDSYDAAALKPLFGPLPDRRTLQAARKVKLVRELMRAWDPVAQEIVWEQETSSGMRGYDGGAMSTAGNLVFQGCGNGEFRVYAADTGKLLKTIQTGSHIMAAPVTYAVDGVQYVAVQTGYGGTAFGVGEIPPSSAARKFQNSNRIIAFKLDGGLVPTPALRRDEPFRRPPANNATPADIQSGEIAFIAQCSRCHALGPNITPDLRKMSQETHNLFKDILLGGALAPMGMEAFGDILSERDVDNIHAYIIDKSWQAYREQEASKASRSGAKAPKTIE
ncbi:PQQ-dependent dehydrogenase, methanol/ethanol family [Methylocystis echinoides]|uniref:PQQ-dependent dehydrogenase, methanol/ethanol family n=1 Tax=Methylocystis echinoides TaxID=29468 RepID=UPI003442DB75